MMIDNSVEDGFKILASFWGNIAEIEYEVGEIIAIKGAKVSTYGGKSLNVDTSSLIYQNEDLDDLKETEGLREWYQNYKN